MSFLLTMKEELIFKHQGFITLEILLAMTIIVSVIATVLPLVAGDQSILVDSQTNQEALYKAQDFLEQTQVMAKINFASVNTSAVIYDDIYQKQLMVNPLFTTQCAKDVTSNVSWATDNRLQNVSLPTRLSDLTGTIYLGSDCNFTSPTSTWINPTAIGHIDLGPGNTATDIDVLQGIAFITAQNDVATEPDFFIANVSDPQNPVIISSINTGPGLNTVDVARDLETGNIFAYVANNKTSQQFLIINVDVSNNFANPFIASSINLAPAPLGTDSEGKSIYYYNKKVYVGTNYLPAIAPNPFRPEFHIFDVSNPYNPFEIGLYDVNHNINHIIVQGNYAYMATSDNNGEVWVLDISNSANPVFVSKFDATGNEDGQSLYLMGNTLYLGREHTPSTRPDFYILDVSDPEHITILGSKNMATSPSTAKIHDIIVSGRFAFLATSSATKEFMVLDILHPENIPNPVSTLNLPQELTGIDLENNIMYGAIKSNDALSIITSTP